MRRITTEPSERRAMKSWLVPPPYIMNDELKRHDTERKLFAHWPGPAAESGRVTADEEVLLFKQLHCSAYRLSKLYKSAHHKKPSALKRHYSKWVQRYNQIRARLIQGNLGLVYDLIGRSRFGLLDRDEMSSEGMMALLRAVDTFDPWRGFRFSTYACNAILRAFSRAALQDSKRRRVIIGTWDPEFEKSDAPDIRRTDQRALYIERLRRILRADEADLTDIEKTVLERRFPSEYDGPRQTLEQIGRQMQVSKERVRQIQLSAMRKLRTTLNADTILL